MTVLRKNKLQLPPKNGYKQWYNSVIITQIGCALIQQYHLSIYGIPMIKIRRSHLQHENPMTGKTVFICKQGSDGTGVQMSLREKHLNARVCEHIRQINVWTGIRWYLGPRLNIKSVFPRYGIPMFKIRRSWDRLIFNTGIPVLVRRHLYTETAPGILNVSVS